MNQTQIKIFSCTVFALLAFAGNSILCRFALGDNLIDAASFTLVRLVSGIIALFLILIATNNLGNKSEHIKSYGDWVAACMLFLYAITFSLGYITLDTGVGALILFASVQITMLIVNFFKGNKLHYSEWLGLIIAFMGFVYLILPTLTTPSNLGVMLMVTSGIAWAFYTLIGRGSQDPLRDTAYNFYRTLPFILILFVFSFKGSHLTVSGIYLAVLSGAITSGLGYAIWYIALNDLKVSQAAVVQLCVPVIAAFGGVIFIHESFTQRLVISSFLVLGGILLVIVGQKYLAKVGH